MFRHLTLLAKFSALVATLFACMLPLTGATNPEPCKEDYVCLYAPTVTGTVIGENNACYGTVSYWTLEDVPIAGSKQKCKETPEQVYGTTTWSWAITGPQPANGTGKSASMTPTSCGKYTITFTGHTKSDSPCTDPTDVTATKSFNVPTPPVTTTIANVEVCPGKDKNAHWTIQNTSDECIYTYQYLAIINGGDPTITLSGDEGSITVSSNSTGEGDVKVTAAQSTKRGEKTLDWYVFAVCDQSSSKQWTAEVPKPKCSLTPPAGIFGSTDFPVGILLLL